MATFTYTPSFQASQSSKPRVRKFASGDAYEQRVTFGLHPDLKQWTLTFENRDNDETAAIQGFLQARAGVESFTWTAPLNGSNPAQYVCDEWQVTMIAYNVNTIQATFREVAEP